MAHRRTRRSSSKLKNNMWSVVLLNDVLVPVSPGVEALICEPDEWQAASTGFEHATLLRIRGWLSFTRISATPGTFHTVFIIIYKVDQDQGVVDASVGLNYTNEDVLWTGGLNWPSVSTVVGPEGTTPVTMDIDVKAMRRIDSGTDIRISLVSTVNNVTRASGVIRALIRKS